MMHEIVAAVVLGAIFKHDLEIAFVVATVLWCRAAPGKQYGVRFEPSVDRARDVTFFGWSLGTGDGDRLRCDLGHGALHLLPRFTAMISSLSARSQQEPSDLLVSISISEGRHPIVPLTMPV